ncbi:MAG: hypothetical protein JOZ51_11335 [Chloroflexi bacterium]|nr:hypothetical protein [Chloroflexota bacterium]
MTADFDALAAEGKRTQSEAAMAQLWAAVYALPSWYFVIKPERQPVSPFVGVVDNQPFLMAFTDKQRADQFARRQGFVDASGATSILATPVQGMVENAEQYRAQGVFGILFNDGPNGFFAPLANLTPMWQYFQKQAAEQQ